MREIVRRSAIGEITPEERRILEMELLLDARLSTGHGCHVVTSRDIVTVTPEQITNFKSAVVDNTGQSDRGDAESPAKGEEENPATEATIEDHPKISITTWVPASEIAKPEDIDRLRPLRFERTPLQAR